LFSQLAALRPYQRAIAAIASALSLSLVIAALCVPAAFPLGWPMRLDLFGTGSLGLSLALNPALYGGAVSEHPFRQSPVLCKVLMAVAALSWSASLMLYVSAAP
jgi:hypothetical protein